MKKECFVKRLPIFNGYEVDDTLQQFQRYKFGFVPEYIPFQSPRGMELIGMMQKNRLFIRTHGRWMIRARYLCQQPEG